jgi:hypothetical protein
MLYLNPPFYLIEGVTLFPDHLDQLQYYFLPMQPHFTMIKGPGGTPIPSMQLIKYKGDAGTGGFFNFDVDLSLPPGTLDTIAGELRGMAKLSGTPRLAPVPLVDGSVKLILLGQESPAPPDPKTGTTPAPPPPPGPPPDPATSGPQFVRKIQGASKPSLYGNNNATFSVELAAEGVTVMEQAMQGMLSPIGIIYELDFLALRPAFSVKVTADWNRVQHHLDESFNSSFLFFSSQIDTVVDKLIEDRVIQIDVDTFVPEGEDDSVTQDRDRAVNEVREMVKSTFFESSIPPPTPGQPDGWDKAGKFLSNLSTLAVSGGISSTASFGYRKIDMTRIDQKSLNMTFNERTTIRRQVYPQGHLAGLFNVIRNAGISLDQFVVSANLNDPYFQRRTVNVVSRANFDAESLAAISVNLKYGDTMKTVELKSSTDSGSVSWPSVLTGPGAMQRQVGYTYDCVFKNVSRTQRPEDITSAQQTTTSDTLEVQPSAFLYAYAMVPLVALGNLWDTYVDVQVDTKYDDDANNIHLQTTFHLTQGASVQYWQLFMRDLTKRSFQYRVTYRAFNNRDIVGGWVTSDEGTIILRDPLPNKRTLFITPAVDWSVVDRVEVDVNYTEADGSISAEGHYEFSEADATSKVFSTPLKDPTRRLVGYQITIIKKGGFATVVPQSFTAQPRLIVLTNMKGHMVVSLRPAAVDFTGAHIKAVTGDIQYVDDVNHLSFSDTFTFKTSADSARFEFDYVDDQNTKYRYRVVTQYTNGLSKTVDWTQAEGVEVVVPVGT